MTTLNDLITTIDTRLGGVDITLITELEPWAASGITGIEKSFYHVLVTNDSKPRAVKHKVALYCQDRGGGGEKAWANMEPEALAPELFREQVTAELQSKFSTGNWIYANVNPNEWSSVVPSCIVRGITSGGTALKAALWRDSVGDLQQQVLDADVGCIDMLIRNTSSDPVQMQEVV